MDVRYTKDKVTGRVTTLTIEASGAADEMFLGDLVNSFKEGTDIETTGPNGVRRVFTPGFNEEHSDDGEEL